MSTPSHPDGLAATPLAALARWASRRRRGILAAALLFTLVAGLLSVGLGGHLADGGWLAPRSPSAQARSALAQSPHAGAPPVVILATGSRTVDDPATRAAGIRLVERLRQIPGVRGGDSYWTGPVGPATTQTGSRPSADPLLRSTDQHTAVIALWLSGDQRTQRTTADKAVTTASRHRGPMHIQATGEAVITGAVEQASERSMLRMELLALPATLALLVFVFGSVTTACLPLAVGAVAITGSAASCAGSQPSPR
ncbi:MMPL family transporter [Streptomyces sp. NPDC005930]|uniref:MMPL family transporter n=1 Tax=Streptomyces sp. NPDC005930 TaxID=3364736 RepID=UPI00369C0850